MDRGATVATLTEMGNLSATPIFLGEIIWGAGTIRLTTFDRDVVWNSNTFLARQGLVEVGTVEENAESRVTSTDITVQIVDQAWMADFLNYDYIGRAVTIWKGYFANGSVVLDPVVYFQGTMDDPRIVDDHKGGTSTLTVSIINNRGRHIGTAGRRTNHEEQQRFFPGDKGFDHVSEIPLQLQWGRA